MNNILFISFSMPPLKYPRSVQIGRLIKNLPFKPNVIYADEIDTRDYTIFPEFEDYVSFKKTIFYKKDNKYIAYLKRKLLPCLYQTPDLQEKWANTLYIVAKDFLNDNPQEILVSFAAPMSVHLAALKLKKKFKKLKWIAHFSDPWTLNPIYKMDPFTKIINYKLEKDVLENADKLIFTSEETIELYKNNFNIDENKIFYLPHSYDESKYDYSISEKTKTHNIVIRYTGGFYGARSPEPLYKVVEILRNKNILRNVVFELYGDYGRHKYLIKKYSHLNDFIKSFEAVSYQKSLELMLSSDLLLVIDAPSEKSVFFPSKLVDYIGSKRPIFGITGIGASRRIIEELGGVCADPLNVEEIANKLESILLDLNSYKNRFDFNKNCFYESKNVAKMFVEILEK